MQAYKSGEGLERKILVKLTKQEANELLMIVTDEDEKEALHFLKMVLEKRVKEAMRPHCVPVFEQSYTPRQKERFKK